MCAAGVSAPGIGARVKRVEAVGRPLRAGREHDRARRRRASISARRQLAVVDELDVGQPLERSHPVGGQPAPLGEAGQAREQAEVAAHRGRAVDEAHARGAAARERERALHAGRPAADDERVEAVRQRREALGVPAAPVLLAGGRVLGAADVAAGVGLGDADVAADALADLVDAPLVDLARQERVGDRRPRGADQIPHAAAHDLGHQVGVGQAADADDRLGRRLAHARRCSRAASPRRRSAKGPSRAPTRRSSRR